MRRWDAPQHRGSTCKPAQAVNPRVLVVTRWMPYLIAELIERFQWERGKRELRVGFANALESRIERRDAVSIHLPVHRGAAEAIDGNGYSFKEIKPHVGVHAARRRPREFVRRVEGHEAYKLEGERRKVTHIVQPLPLVAFFWTVAAG